MLAEMNSNLQYKFLDYDRDLTNSDTFDPDSLFPASLEGRNSCIHRGHRYDRCLHFGMGTVAGREEDLWEYSTQLQFIIKIIS